MAKKYRLPIMERAPFIIRRPLVDRTPMVTPKAVFDRTPITCTQVHFDECALCANNTDCGGYKYYTQGDEVSPDNPQFGLVRYQDGQSVTDEIEALEDAGVYTRLIADAPVTSGVLFALAYSPFNIVQYNFNDQYPAKEWQQSIHKARSCGLYIAIKLPVIIPTVVKLQDILQLMEKYSNVGKYFCIQFMDTKDVMPYCAEGFYNVNGALVPEKYVTDNGQGGIQVNEDFLMKFLSTMNRYVKPKKLNVMVCYNGKCY